MTIDEVWKSQTPTHVEEVEMAVQRSHRRQSRLKLELMAEVLGGGCAVAVGIWFVLRAPGPLTYLLLGLCVIVVLASTLNQIALQRAIGLVRAPVADHLLRRQKQVNEELKSITRGIYVWRFTTTLVLFWALLVGATNLQAYLESPGRFMVGFGGIVVILLFSNRALKKRRAFLTDEKTTLNAWLMGYEDHSDLDAEFW